MLIAGCAPITPYRYTGMTPAARPIAWDGYPSHAGEVHGELSVSHTAVVEKLFPEIHDTALEVASTNIEAAASISPVRGLDIGIRFSYAAYAFTERTAVGTMPVPGNPNLWGVGPEARGAFFLDHEKHYALGFAASFMHYQVPWAAYTLAGGSAYAFDHAGSDSDWTMTFGIYPSYSFGPDGKYGTFFLLAGGTNSFKNDGFATSPSSGSTIQEDGFLALVGGGYGLHTPYFHVNAMTYVPIGGTINYGPGALLTLAFDLPLWHPKGGRLNVEPR